MPTPSRLDANQVLQHAYDDASGKLKVDAEVSATIGNVDVVIDASGGDNISIASADGTKALAINDDGSISTRVAVEYKTIIDEVDATTTYVGRAAAGSSVASASWQISKFTTTGTVTAETNADGDFLFNNIWNNRAALSYS